MLGSLINGRYKDLSLVQNVLTSSGAHSGSSSLETRESFPKLQHSGRETDHSPMYSAKLPQLFILQ